MHTDFFRFLSGSATKYAVLSGISFGTVFSLTFMCHEWLGAPEELAYLIALAAGIATNFIGMRYFVYPVTQTSIFVQFFQFARAAAVFRLLEYLTFLFMHVLLGINYLLTIIVISFFFIAFKYFYFKGRVFQ